MSDNSNSQAQSKGVADSTHQLSTAMCKHKPEASLHPDYSTASSMLCSFNSSTNRFALILLFRL